MLPLTQRKQNRLSPFILGVFCACLLLLSAHQAKADSDISENITANTSWSLPDYRIKNDIKVSEGATLTIGEGVTVKFNSGTSLTIGDSVNVNGTPTVSPGTLLANGTSTHPITFTSNQVSKTAGYWDGITFNAGSDASIMKYTVVEYAENNLMVTNANPTIENSTIRNASESGLDLTNSSLSLTCSTITQNPIGIESSGLDGHPTMYGNDIMTNTNVGMINQPPEGSEVNPNTLDARSNYWGAADGPGGFAEEGGGDAISNGINYDNYLTSAGACSQTFAANFTHDAPTTGCEDIEVQFTDTSAGVVESWNWDFDGLAVSVLKKPTVLFTEAGTYSVTLTVSNRLDDAVIDTFTDNVTVGNVTDTDGDDTIDCFDLCPSDPQKVVAGICGCGVADTDTDGDGTPNCHDACPTDNPKTAAGICGCAIADTDDDGDGTPNCIDACPADSAKTAPGVCGCGINDSTDSDSDGTVDCLDACDEDQTKIATGSCGCGVAETDSDGDGTPNCIDACPTDNPKTSAGVCGCGVADTDSDGDGTPDCIDGCPADRKKTSPGTAGCGKRDKGKNNNDSQQCVPYIQYSAPLKGNGTTFFGRGSTLPINVSMNTCDNANPQEETVRIRLFKQLDRTGNIEEITLPGSNGEQTYLSWSAGDKQYVYSLSTQNFAKGRYRVIVENGKGQAQSAYFRLR